MSLEQSLLNEVVSDARLECQPSHPETGQVKHLSQNSSMVDYIMQRQPKSATPNILSELSSLQYNTSVDETGE